MVFQRMKIPSELTPSERKGQTWSEVGLMDVGSVSRFRQLLEEKGWQAGQQDAAGHTLSGALVWKVLWMRKQMRSAEPMTSWLRQLRVVLEKEAASLSPVERWWATALKQTPFVRYSAWHGPYNAAMRQLSSMADPEELRSAPATLVDVLEKTQGFLPLEEWAFQEPLGALWKHVEALAFRPWEGDRKELVEVLSVLSHPATSPLVQAHPSQVWDWNWWVKGGQELWAAVLAEEAAWVALENTGVGSSAGVAERRVHDQRLLKTLGAALEIGAVELQELEKLLPSSQFLPRLKSCWERWQWDRTWESAPQVPRGPRL